MTPAAPNPYDTARAQTGSNTDSAIAAALVNNYDETGPFGSVKYSQNGTRSYVDSNGNTVNVPQTTRTTTLDPAQQALLDKQNAAGANLGDLAVSQTKRLQGVLDSPFNPDMGPTDFSDDRRRVEEATLSRFNTDFDRTKSATENKLLNQGLTPGSEAWETEMDQLGRQQNDAIMSAVLAGGNEQTRLANLRNQGFQEKLAVRNQPINEISALLSGSQVNVPQFAQGFQQGVSAAPIGQYINDGYQSQVANSNAMMTGLFGLGSSAIKGAWGLSDRRAKKDVSKVGETPDDLGVYKFRYKGEGGPRHVGLMAQDVKRKKPHAVATGPDGLMRVNYAEALRA